MKAIDLFQTRLPSCRRSSRGPTRYRRARFEQLESRTLLAADITTGLAHHWAFDETSGDTAADSAGGSPGTLVGWTANEPKWVPGRVGGALRFDTADNYVVATPPAMSGSYAVSFWLNVKDLSGVNPRILAARSNNEIIVASSSNRSAGYYSGNAVATSPEPSTFNTWEHFAINFNADSGQGIVYRSGSPVAIGAFTDSASLATWFIGHSNNPANNSDTLKGALDDLRVYDRLLTDKDVNALASLGVPEPTHQGPVHHWTFDETTGFTAFDTAGDADGVLLNWNQAEPRWEPGIVGGALRFSTADNAVVTPAIATGAVWTTAFWLNVQSRTGINPRIQEPAGAYINLESNRGIGFTSRNQHTFDPTPVALDEWEHYAVTYDTINDVGTIYRNGVPVKSGPYYDNAPAAPWVFGHQNNLGNHNDSLDGLLDDFRHYDRLLSPSEIQILAGQSNPQPPTAGLIHHWTFDETIGDIAADIVGGNDGELRNYGPTQSKWVPGKIGGAISFTDGDDLVITESPITEDKYSFSFWLNQTGGGGFNPRLINPGDEDWLVLWQFAGRGIHFSDSQVWDPRPATRNVWEHYTVTLDQTTDRVEFYRSGVLVASGSYPNKPPPIKQWVMGHSGTLNWHVDTLHGMLDDMRVYDRVLSGSEIQLLAAYQPLEARPDQYSTREDVALTISSTNGVQKNDSTAGAGTRAVVATFPANGQLTLNENSGFTYTPTKDFNGTDTFTYRLEYGAEISSPATVTITITPVNDAPSFLVGGDRFVDDESGSRAIGHWASQVKAGPPDEANQTLTFIAVADKPELLAVQPKIELFNGTWGRLTYTVARNKVGVVNVTVTLKDSGGTADGGVDTSPPQTFKIHIAKKHPGHNAVNPLDVNVDSRISGGDALAIINYINAFGVGPVPPASVSAPPYYDVVPDGVITGGDALAVINYINANPPAEATFLGSDSTTQGDWLGVYGAEGYSLNSDAALLPTYATLAFSNLYDVVWNPSPTDVRALQLPDGSGRLASAWTGNNPENPDRLNGMIFHLSLTDGQLHRVTIYCLDWDTVNRRQMIEILDATTEEVLDTRLAEPFHDGKYYSWLLRGGVKIRFTNLANGLNTVASGIFFDPI